MNAIQPAASPSVLVVQVQTNKHRTSAFGGKKHCTRYVSMHFAGGKLLPTNPSTPLHDIHHTPRTVTAAVVVLACELVTIEHGGECAGNEQRDNIQTGSLSAAVFGMQ